MLSKRVEELLYESAAVLRRVDRELQDIRSTALAGPSANDAAAMADAACVEREEVAHYDRSELLSGLDRVSRHLNEMSPAGPSPVSHP